jgi:threonine synthase
MFSTSTLEKRFFSLKVKLCFKSRKECKIEYSIMAKVWLQCINCNKKYKPEVIYRCKDCNDLLEVKYDLKKTKVSKNLFNLRLKSKKFPFNSGVWRFKELIHPLIKNGEIVSRPEGNTNLYSHERLNKFVGIKNLILKHEGENPTGSFKDRGMTVGISEAKRQNAKIVACASTGNTAASLAAYAAMAKIKCMVFIPKGEIAYGKLSQALAYGAKVFQIRGNFDDAMKVIQETTQLGIYLLNSINPWRIEGQKSIMFELIQQLNWEVPDWIIFPAGNLGNASAFGKALEELKKLGLIDKLPKLVAVQAEGAAPFYKIWRSGSDRLITIKNPKTIASAIRIGNPVNWRKALKALRFSKGIVEKVSDQEIMDAKAVVDRCGIGCEPSSAASVAGARKLRRAGLIDFNKKVVCILTGNVLKDSEATTKYHLSQLKNIKPKYANKPIVIGPKLKDVIEILRSFL